MGSRWPGLKNTEKQILKQKQNIKTHLSNFEKNNNIKHLHLYVPEHLGEIGKHENFENYSIDK